MKFSTVRTFALSLPEVTEAPHHNFGSLRVKGKIFVTIPPGETLLHVFVPDDTREQALAVYPAWTEKLMWGGKAVGVRVQLAKAEAIVVKRLVRLAWEYKAPKRLLTGAGSSTAAPSGPRRAPVKTPRAKAPAKASPAEKR